MRSLRTLANICVAALAVLSGNLPEARGEFIVDQSQTSFNVLVNLRFSGVTGQEFTAALPSLDVVELLFDGPDGTFPPDIPGEFSVSIQGGGMTGAVVATSFSVTLLTGIFREVVRFDFPTSVPLVPGDLYGIEINRLSDPGLPFFFAAIDADTYPGGRAIIDGQSRPDFDLFFREGPRSVVPEPSTLTLCGLGALGLLGYGWLRRQGKRTS
jgi:hypothetical protein